MPCPSDRTRPPRRASVRPVTPRRDSEAPTAPRGRPARYSRDELVAVVVQEFLARGYDATSMEDLARATGLTKSSIYHHVSGKEELLRLAVGRASDALSEVISAAETGPGAAADRLEQALRRSAEVLVEQLPYVTVLLRVRGNTEAERWALTQRRTVDRRLAALVQAAIDEGDVRGDLDPSLVSRLLFGMVNGVVEWWRPGGATEAAELADAVATLAFQGLRRT